MIIEREAYTLTIRSLPHRVPAIIRLRKLLKVLLRGFGFKVVKIVEDDHTTAPLQASAAIGSQSDTLVVSPGGPAE